MPLHSQRTTVDIQQRFLLFHVGGFLLPDPDDLLDHLHVEASAFGLGEDVCDVALKSFALTL